MVDDNDDNDDIDDNDDSDDSDDNLTFNQYSANNATLQAVCKDLSQICGEQISIRCKNGVQQFIPMWTSVHLQRP